MEFRVFQKVLKVTKKVQCANNAHGRTEKGICVRRHAIILSISVVVCLYFFSLVKHITKQTFHRFHINFSKSQRMDAS